MNAHVILCFRAEPKVEVGPGNTIIPKPSLTGLDGWIPISEKMLPYELTASFLLMADRPGVPKPIKLQEQHRAMVPLDQPLTEETGKALAAWAAGTSSAPIAAEVAAPSEEELVDRILGHASDREAAAAAIEAKRAAVTPAVFHQWLVKQAGRVPAARVPVKHSTIVADTPWYGGTEMT